MRALAIGVVLMLGAPVAASAGPADAEACAAGLSPQAKMIYDAVRGTSAGNMSLPNQVKAQTRHLVQSGRIALPDARPAAMAAGGCLKHAQE